MKRKSVGIKTHGESHTNLHNIWCGMNSRCDPNHKHSDRYGKRGIAICDEWHSYEAFAEWARANGYREGLSIERIDVNGNYEPGNCKWIPPEQQARNRRTTHWVVYNGREMSLAEACELAGMPYKQVFWRMARAGWPFEKAISVPIGYKPKRKYWNHTCVVCGRPFATQSNNGKYCTHECYLAFRRSKNNSCFKFALDNNEKH